MRSDTKTAIVTAAGSGIGAGIARELAQQDYSVVVFSSTDKSEKLAAELGGLGVKGSILNPEDLSRLVDQTIETFGRIDAVVNGSGHGPKGELLEISDEQWHTGMDYYLMNVVRMCRMTTPYMLENGGAFVNLSTFAAFEPDPDFPTSAAFRAALASFVKLYADRYAADNIRINNVLPGFIDSLPEKSERRERIPMNRYGTVDEIAKTVAFLLSDGAAYITGQNIRIDGSLTRSV